MSPDDLAWLCLKVLWVAWTLQAAAAVLQARKFYRVLGRSGRSEYFNRYPPAAVVVPFRGLDEKLDHTIRSLCEQEYESYRLLLVVDSSDDPAYAALTDALSAYPQRDARVLIAGPSAADEGQKIHNQIHAIDHLTPPRDPDEVWVFADSDAIVSPRWLSELVAPVLKRQKSGLSTGYRWLVPAGHGGEGRTAWSHLASVINSSVACQYGRGFHYAWGGSMAVRAQTAIEGGLRGRLRGALCDDFQFSSMARDLGKQISFVPHCLCATEVDFTWASLMNFGHRQYLLTRVYAPGLFAMAWGALTLYVCGFFSAWAALIAALLSGGGPHVWGWPAGAIAAVFVLGQVRSTVRARIVERAFGADMVRRLCTTLRIDRWLTPVWMTLHWLIVTRSAFGRRMTWRGITYELFGRQNVKRLDPRRPTESSAR